MRGITKRFPGVLALDGVDLAVGRSEVVALIGENGAGKSTLMKVLGGIHPPDSGTIRIDGVPRAVSSVEDATRAGVALIHQELNLADNLTVAENVFLGHEPVRGGGCGSSTGAAPSGTRRPWHRAWDSTARWTRPSRRSRRGRGSSWRS